MRVKYKEGNIEDTFYSENILDVYGLSLDKFKYIIDNSSRIELNYSEIPNILSDWTYAPRLNEHIDSLRNHPNINYQVQKILKDEPIFYSIVMREESGRLTILDGGHRLLSAYKLERDVEVIVIPELLSKDIFTQKIIDEWFIKNYPDFKNNIKDEFKNILNEYLNDGETIETINNGLCADFANSLNNITKHSSMIVSIYDYEDLFNACVDFDFKLPFDISPLEKMDKFYFPFGHTFLFYEGKFFDSECIEGVYKIEDIPIIKRNIKEYLEEPFVNKIWININAGDGSSGFIHGINGDHSFVINTINKKLEDSNNIISERLNLYPNYYKKKIYYDNKEIYICVECSLDKELSDTLDELIDSFLN